MKRVILILCVIIIAVSTGCSSSNNSSAKPTKSNGIVVYNGLKNPDRPQPMDYLDYLETNHGIKVIPTPWDDSMPIHELDGLLKIDLKSYRTSFDMRHDLFLPLNDILSSNIYSSEIPDGIMSAVTDNDGNIWGFLISHDIDIMARSYNEEAVARFGGELPDNPSELKAFLQSSKEALGMDAIRVTADYCAQAFYDIFSYYGCALLDSKYTVGWNVPRQMYIDITYNDQILQSLQFIKELDEAGLINHIVGDYNTLSSAFDTGKTISTTRIKGLGHESKDKYISSGFDDSVYYLEYGSEKISYQDFEYNFIYVVPVNTSDAEKKVHAFIDTFYGNEKMNKIGKWGAEGENFIYKTPDLIMVDVLKDYYKPQLSDWWLETHYMRSWTEEESEYYQFWINSYWPEVKSNYYNSVYQLIPIEKTIDDVTRTSGRNELHTTFNTMLYKMIVEDMSIDAFIKEYQEKMNKLGIIEYLELLNSSVQ